MSRCGCSPPLRQNGSRESIIRVLCRCGTPRKDAEKMVPKRRPGTRDKRTSLTPVQVKLFEKVVNREIENENLRHLLKMMLFTGMRVAEASVLQWGNIIKIKGKPAIQLIGKGHKPRVVPLGRHARALLNQIRKRSDFLFPNTRGTGPLSSAAVQKACRDIGDAEPELQGLTPHVLRHTYMTLALLNCHDIRQIRDAVGHEARGKDGGKLPVVSLSYFHPTRK